MAEHDVTIKTNIVADTSGAEKAKSAIREIGEEAKKQNSIASSSKSAISGIGEEAKKQASIASEAFGGFSKAVSAAGNAIGTFTKALGIIGFAVQGVQLLIDTFQKVKEWLDRDRRAAEELSRAVQDAKNKEAIEASAAAYEKLNAGIAEAVRLENERDKNAARRQSIERAAEDARTELEMQQELAGIDRSDPDYASKAELVRSKYARIRAQRAADRASRDLNAQQMGLYAKADENEERAHAYEKDVYGKSGDAVISLKKQIYAEKDTERKKNLEAQLDALLKEQQKKLAEIKKLRDEAESLRKEAAALMGADTAAHINARSVNVAQDAADADTRRRMGEAKAAREAAAAQKEAEEKAAAAKKEAEEKAAAAQKEADEKTVAEGKEKMGELGKVMESEQDRARAAANAYAKEQGDVVAAQGRYDMVVANGGSRRERSDALAALQKEKEEAEEAKYEMEKVAAQVASTVKAIKEQINALSRAMKQAETRLGANQADAPEG